MINISFGKFLFASTIISILLSVSTLFSQEKSNDSRPGGSIKITYIYPAANTFKYVSDTKIVEDMDVNGQSMLVNVSMNMGCQVKSAGKQGENLKLEVKIDSMAQNVESPQGSAGGSINDVKGKTFNIIISPSGKTIDLKEASNIVYTIEGSGESNLGQAFLTYFPSLPSGAVKPGDTWVTNDTIDTKSASRSVLMLVEATYKFEGIENIGGVDCAKISATLAGTRKMTNQSQGMGEIHISGPFTGTQEFFIALKDGYLLKETANSKMTGTIEIPDQGYSFPVVMTITSKN
jgi:hypothetical protein